MQLGANALPRPLLHRPGRRPLAPPLPAKGGNDKKGGSSGSSSGGSSGKGKPAGKPEESKADFSALWAQRFKQFFSARRQYLAQADVSPEEEQAQKEYQRKLDADKSKLADMKVAYKEARLAVLGEQYAAGEEVMKKYDVEALKAEGASQEEIEAAQQTLTASGRSLIEVDVDRARQEM